MDITLGFDIKDLLKLSSALLAGDDNLIEKLVVEKLEHVGQDELLRMIKDQLGSAAPAESDIQRIIAGVESGGFSEFQRARNSWMKALNGPRFPGVGAAQRFEKAFIKNSHYLIRPDGKYQKWDASRQQWIDQNWQHDWRSQPRDWHGRWVPGRLRSPYVNKGARRIRRARRKARREDLRNRAMAVNQRGS